MKQHFLKKFLLLILLSNILYANNTTLQYILWQKKPIEIVLPLKQSRQLQFAHPVEVGIPTALNDKLTIENQSGTVTFHILKGFNTTRVPVKDVVTNNTILLSLNTSENAPTTPLAILYQTPNQPSDDSTGWLKTPDSLQGELSYVTLTRFAEQALYAPKRLQKNPYGIELVQSYVRKDGGVNSNLFFHNLFYDNSTINIPWATWRGGDIYVTAVLIRNLLPTKINLTRNLTLLCGHDNGVWKTVTFYPNWQLAKVGQANDSTVAFLISTKPFEQARQSCEVAHD